MFDAFDTLIHIDRNRLVEHRAGQKTIQTTAPKLHAFYQDAVAEIAFDRFLEAFLESSREANRRRKETHREIPSADRFGIMLDLLGRPAGPPELAVQLAESHMGFLAPALTIPDEHRHVLEWSVANGYRVAMISNFDYAPTLYQCLERYGIRGLFASIVVSDEVGWRKPHPAIFERAFGDLGVHPSESLFVGDRLDLDVAGAAGVGMDVVWIDAADAGWSPEHAHPQHTIRALRELLPILNR